VSKRRNAPARQKIVSLLILEGDTEEVFYPIIRDKFLKGIRIELRNIKGRGNVNKDVLAEIYKYAYNNCDDSIRAYCCIDTESNTQSATPFELELVRNRARERRMNQVLSIDCVLADPDIESWFFHDIEGIYGFLRVKSSRRKTKGYINRSDLNKKDLKGLFHTFGKEYLPGKRAQNFINSLDVEKIVSCCNTLRNGIQMIKSLAEDLTNHLTF
jgi:hypothetical protein